MTHPTDEELDALVAQQTRAANKRDEFEALMNADRTVRAITALRAQLADVQADLTFMTENRNKWQDSANQRWFRIEEAEARTDRAEAAMAAQIEADAGIAAAETAMPSRYNIKDQWRSGIGDEVAAAIRSQPHDRSALDRMLAEHEVRLREARTNALREAADMFDADSNIAQTILALIEKDKEN